MHQPSLTDFFSGFRKPIRDALRGVVTIADTTEDLLEPAAQLLPEPIRNRFRDALSACESAGKRLVYAPIDPDRVRRAAEFVQGLANDRESLESCAAVVCHAWEHLQKSGAEHRFLISETLLAGKLTRLPDNTSSPGATAAALLGMLRNSNVIGLMPGVASGIPGGERDATDLALTAIVVWLLSARDDGIAGEEKLLDLSSALITAVSEDVLGAIDQPDELAALLLHVSAHL
ncbi:MAG: hypothetical protein OXF07_09435 [Rhodobacter sp.]|nr:hypothetical protein [Rhodobacter sp.]MCY4167369.1 hypothetical protein [Rhodobacter sp.]MCY4241060.1 hypothetical protein [Rhodobacter sp.]